MIKISEDKNEKTANNVEDSATLNPNNLIAEELEKQLHQAYLKGLSTGGKAFIGAIYENIKEGKKKHENPLETLRKVKSQCEKFLNIFMVNQDTDSKTKNEKLDLSSDDIVENPQS